MNGQNWIRSEVRNLNENSRLAVKKSAGGG